MPAPHPFAAFVQLVVVRPERRLVRRPRRRAGRAARPASQPDAARDGTVRGLRRFSQG